MIDQALGALVERELERRWLAGHAGGQVDDDLPGEIAVQLGDLPWDAEGPH